MEAAKNDLQRRRPVWGALSTLFLDTDTSLDRQRRAQVLAASEYSLKELEEILITEVYPACGPNLLSVAGEWAGFDTAWLEERILSRRPSRLHRFSLGRLLFAREVASHKGRRYVCFGPRRHAKSFNEAMIFCLVRPMRHVASAFIVLLSSCTAVEHRQQPLYPPLLSASDIAEITTLVARRPDIRQSIYEIQTEGERPDRAVVIQGSRILRKPWRRRNHSYCEQRRRLDIAHRRFRCQRRSPAKRIRTIGLIHSNTLIARRSNQRESRL